MTATQTHARAQDHQAFVELVDNGVSSVTIDGTLHPLRASDVEGARGEALELMRAAAASLNEALSVTSVEPAGSFEFVLGPDGATRLPNHTARPHPHTETSPQPAGTPAPVAATPTTAPSPDAAPATPPATPVAPAPEAKPAAYQSRSAAGAASGEMSAPVHPPKRKEVQAELRRMSLLEEMSTAAPAHHGVRGALNSLGLHLPPSKGELRMREDIAKVSQHWAGPRTIAVVNGKGGSSKTPSTVLLAAILARYGGGSVMAWDNNSTRGTLGWRTEKAKHGATVVDLLPHAERLLGPQARAADLAQFTHHQSVDRFDVLRSDPTQLSSDQPADEASFRAVHSVLSRYYRIILIDSGNDESLPAWSEMIRRADAIVVPTITRPEHAESARLLLEGLARAGGHAAQLADQATVVVSQASAAEPSPAHYVKVFSGMARAAVGIPYDAAMSSSPLLLDCLASRTRRAWLAAASALADALG